MWICISIAAHSLNLQFRHAGDDNDEDRVYVDVVQNMVGATGGRFGTEWGLSASRTRALFGADAIEIEIERDGDFGHALEKGVALFGADLGHGAKLGEVLLSNGLKSVPTQDNGSGTATTRVAEDE